ncbi:HdeD family acid-resistance protein [Nocardiopsis alkaliphila]|uniref:HdeD family acid-resistance protein n=1 Tax=Nocardiopsis alkaliphila TaxID=225762 RepID=UPI00034490A5|nr:HdeD family acid-resistance protein [Nocardiopsis alkaliphila]
MVRYALAGGMLGDLSRNWWLLVVRGVAAVIFGVLALLWPGITMVALAVVFGAFALVDGIALGVSAFRTTSGTRTPMVIQSVLGVLLGLGALIWPIIAVFALVIIIAAWAIVTGVAEIVTAVRMRSQIGSEWLLIFVGALSVIFGLLLLLWPGLGAWALITVIGVYAVIFGVAMAIAGWRLKGEAARTAPTDTEGDGSAEEPDVEGVDLLDGPTGEKDSQEVSAFDDGYGEGYRAGYEGDQRSTGATEASVFDERAASERVGKHRAPKEPPEGTDTP